MTVFGYCGNGLELEFGIYKKKYGPGLYTYNPMTEKIITIDIRDKIQDIPEQALLTKDNISLLIDCYVNYKMEVPEKAEFGIQNYQQLVINMTQGCMKTICAEHTLSELLVNRKLIETKITNIIDRRTEKYGIKVICIETQKIT